MCERQNNNAYIIITTYRYVNGYITMALNFVTSSELLIGQWTAAPRLRGLVDLFLDDIRNRVVPVLERLRLFEEIDTAVGVWLDRLGVRLGLRRPASTDPQQDERIGFTGPTQAQGFDQAPFAGDQANQAVYPLPDAIYRRMCRARAILLLGDGTIQTFKRAVQAIDPGAAVEDQRNMTIRVVTVLREYLELADTVGALPRSAGVALDFQDRGLFGFDDAGQPFDKGAALTCSLMVDNQAKKIELWAEDGDREDPEDLGLDRAHGWPVAYEQIGSGSLPERVVFNQLLRELTGWARSVLSQGSILSWDVEVSYRASAFVTAGGRVWVSSVPTGPATGNPINPEDDTNNDVWGVY